MTDLRKDNTLAPLVDEVLNETKAAHFCDYTPRYLELLRSQGAGPPYVKMGRRITYLKSDLLVWLKSKRVRHTTEAKARDAA